MIKNIIFDVGNVLVDYHPETYLEQLGFDPDTKKAVYDAMFGHPFWNETDRGVLSDEELLAGFISHNPPYEAKIRQAYASVGGTVELMPYAVSWVKHLKARGYQLYILSNYGDRTYQQSRDKMKFLPYMDGVVFSYRCKMIKPDPAIYRYLCDTCRLIPEESVFLDDRADNIAAARQAGIHAIQFVNYEQGSRELDAMLRQNRE